MRQWKYTVRGVRNALHDDSLGFEESRDRVVSAIRASRWFKGYEGFGELPEFVDELADTEDVSDFDSVLAFIYDEADATGAWID